MPGVPAGTGKPISALEPCPPLSRVHMSEALKPAGLSAGSALHHTSGGFSQPAQTAGAWVAAFLLLPVPAPGGSASHAQTAALAGENGFAAIVPQGVLLDPADAFCWLLSGSLWGASETTPKSALELSPGACPQPKAAQSLAGVELCSLGLPVTLAAG